MDERQILLDAKELITRKQFQEARQMLKSIAHNATAQKWLVKLDEIAPPPPSNPFYDDNPFADPNDNPFWSPTPAAVDYAPHSDAYAFMSEEEKFERVKVLLKAKNYEEARQILMTLPDNPSAKKLLAKLHQVAPSLPTGSFGSTTTTNRSSNPPISDPFGARSDSNPFASSYERGPGYEIIPTKPNESMSLLNSSGSRSLTPVGQPTRGSKKSKGTSGAALATGSMAWFGRRMRNKIIGSVIGLVIFGVTTTLGIDLDKLFSGSKTYENDSIELTYTGHWESVNVNTEADCQNAVGQCLLFLEAKSSPTAVMVQNLALVQGSHQTTINLLWDGYQRANVGLQMVGAAGTLKVDGQDAVQWYMTWHSPEGYDMYGMVLYMPTATSVVEIAAWSNSQSIFNGQYDDVQEIINSIEIKQPPR